MQLLVIALIILLLFGASRLGEVGKGLGEGIRNFKKGIAGDGDDEKAKVAPKSEKQLSEGEAKSEKSSDSASSDTASSGSASTAGESEAKPAGDQQDDKA